jgi:gas vesicle protein
MNNGYYSGRGGAGGSFFLGLLLGAVAGGVAALMLAPRSGQETRDMVKNKINQMKEIARDTANDVKQGAQDIKRTMQS